MQQECTGPVEFSAEDASRTDPDYMEQVTLAVVDAGASTVNLPDTVGYSIPDEYAGMIRRMVKANTATMDGSGVWKMTAAPSPSGAEITVIGA